MSNGHRRGDAYDSDFVLDVLLFCELFPEMSDRDVAARFAISHGTVGNWRNSDMSVHAIAARRYLKGFHRRKMSMNAEFVLAGNIIFCDLLRQDTSSNPIREIFCELFDSDEYLNSSYISKFLDRNHLSLKSVTVLHALEKLPNSLQILSDYISDVRSFNCPPDRIFNLDLCSIYSDSRFVRHALTLASKEGSL